VNTDKIIELPCYDLVIHVTGERTGFVTSNLLDGGDEDEDNAEYNAAVDALVGLILAHALAGINVTTPAYIEGIETVVESITNAYT